MCRLFAQLSVRPSNGSDLLVGSECSLYSQSHHKGREQKDGWGLGYFSGGRARIVKSPRAVFKEGPRFKAAAGKAVSRVVIGHLRAASNPRGLAQDSIMGLANTQPFTDGKWVFAHNGTINIPDEVLKSLGPYRRRVKGLNDSEVYFWLFRKHLDRTGSPAAALRACVEELWSLWRGCRARYPRVRAPYTGVNTLVSDGKTLTALCHYTLRGKRLTALCTPGQPWGVMSRSLRDGRLVVASEPMDRGPWMRFGDPEIFEAWVEGGRVRTRSTRFRPPSWPRPAGRSEAKSRETQDAASGRG